MIQIPNVMVLAIVPKKGFENWLRDIMRFFEIEQARGAKDPIEHLEEDCLLYVIPEPASAEMCVEYVKSHYLEFFQDSLLYWCSEKRAWPKDLSYKLFSEFFNVEFHSRLFDLLSDAK
jgi:hypothetical protein